MECHACCAGGSHAVCAVVHARVRDRECDGHACASVRRALARPKRKLVKVAPGYLRKRVKVASQRKAEGPLDAWVEKGEAKGPRREGSHNGGESDCSDRSDRMSGEPS